MCGIVGYTGYKNAVEPILEGLTRLEYRGYDSAGISIKGNNEIQVFKKEGKIDYLKDFLNQFKPFSTIGIGHTRWATHGMVNETNAHPHSNELFSIVHNGIIENAFDLKTNLIKEGFQFKSETDSEVFLVLLTKNYKLKNDFKIAIEDTFSALKGNSAFVIMNKLNENLYAIKNSAPLVCGEQVSKGGTELYVSSDPYALVGFVTKIYFPENGVLCELEKSQKKINFFELDGRVSKRFKSEARGSEIDIATKGEYPHFMLKEIYEQPELIAKQLRYYSNQDVIDSFKKLSNQKFTFSYIVGCGTAWHAGLVIKSFLEDFAKIKVSVELASEFRYRQPILSKQDLGLFISQSGETADTLASAEMTIGHGLQSYSIVNTKGSTLYRLCNENFLINAGQEIGVASTKAFTMQVVAGYVMSLYLADIGLTDQAKNQLAVLEIRISELLKNVIQIQNVAEKIAHYKGFIFTGRGKYYPIALEGALKLKEIAYVHAEGYAAGELKHGPIALIDQEMVNIAIIGPELHEKALSNAEEVKARKGYMVIIGSENDHHSKRIADDYIGLNFDGLSDLSPIYTNIVMQLLSYYIAKIKGTDIDKPRNLAKSVTVE